MKTENRMTTLADLEIGNPKTVLNLTTVPLSGNPASALEYLLIDEALEAKKVIVEEVSEGGSVPELRMTNFANKCVLIVDGTELVGAKQNRIVNASFLIPPESVTRIPVSCVEQGRWEYKGREFGVSKHFAPTIRRDNAEFHKTTLRQNRGYATEQGKVWAHVADMSHQMGAPTMTGAMNDVLEQKEGSIEEYRKGISLDGTWYRDGILRQRNLLGDRTVRPGGDVREDVPQTSLRGRRGGDDGAGARGFPPEERRPLKKRWST